MKIQLNHNDYVIESKFSIAQIKQLRNAAPAALKLVSGADKAPIYQIAVTDDSDGSGMNSIGATFAYDSATTGHAIMHCALPCGVVQQTMAAADQNARLNVLKRYIAQSIGPRLDYLNRIEEQMEQAFAVLNEQENEIMSVIEVVTGTATPAATVEDASDMNMNVELGVVE